MRFYFISLLLSFILVIYTVGCQKKNDRYAGLGSVKIKKLKKYHLLKQDKELLLGQPIRLKYDNNTHHLFIQDLAQRKVIEINDSGQIVNEFGGPGKGPGEVQDIENFFITSKYLFIVDGYQFLINKYDLRNGYYISSLNYHSLLLKSQIPSGPRIPYQDNNNKVFITRTGTILIPTQTGGKFLYEAVNWKGEKLADIGAIPKSRTVIENNDKFFSMNEKKEFLASDSAEAFLVNDCLNPGDIYLVYPAIPKIAKYRLSGEKIWEHNIHLTPEVDTLIYHLSIRARELMNRSHYSRISIRTYVAGRCGPNGSIYLSTFTDATYPKKYRRPLWIDRLGPKGRLMKRYKVGTKINAYYYPALDFKKRRIYVPLLGTDTVRVYSF